MLETNIEMQQQNRRIIVIINMLSEVALIFASYWASVFVRFFVMRGFLNAAMTSGFSLRLILLYSVAIVVLYWLAHLYMPTYYMALRHELIRVVLINLSGTVAFGFLLYVFRITEFSRVALVLFFAAATFLVGTKRILVHAVMRKERIAGNHQIHVIYDI